MNDAERARDINAYADHIKTLIDEHGKGYDGNERTLLVIGYASGWDAATSNGRVGKAVRERDSLNRRLDIRWGELCEARADRDAAVGRAEAAEAALRELVALKDGPRGADYERRKPLAWEVARRALDGTP